MESNLPVMLLVERLAGVGAALPADGPMPPEARLKLQNLAKELGFALETPLNTFNRLSILHSVVRAAINLDLFEYVIDAGPSGRFDFINPVFQKMPESLAKNDYRCPSAHQGPLQDAYNTELSGFEFIMEPRWADTLKDCNLFMEGRRQGSVSWLNFYPFGDRILAGATEDMDSALVVDVGGGLGHGLVEIQEKYPNTNGRLILQDLPNTIQQAGDGGGFFKPMAHDFFTSQPVKVMQAQKHISSDKYSMTGPTRNAE
ncbi:MAG: hypothetical protein Q9170_007542 [Blastenia crenularia]